MWYNILIVVILLILSGTYAGLTLALFSIKLTTLERKIRLGNKSAEKVYKVRRNGNLLLCALLLGNVASYTIMSIFLGSIINNVVAGFIATSLIFIFGEILPQAIFPRYALQIGSKLIWVVWLSIILFYPVAAPIAWILDKVLGKEAPVLWNKKELEEIIKYHENSGKGIIDKDEERIVIGALTFSDRIVSSIMISISDVFYIETGTVINNDLISKIRSKAFSRVPIINFSQKQIIGILFTKKLIGLPDLIGKTVDDFNNTKGLVIVDKNMKLDNLLNLLVQKKTQMALVTDEHQNFMGVATMEDIMEEILNTELEDSRF